MDCIDGDRAYEFKMRVTAAASGQGRFSEELAFARDCHLSSFTPILLVLDPTPSSRLDDLTAEFEKYGGCAYVGDDAWQHLETKAGPTMSVFVSKYIREPLKEVDASYTAAHLLPVKLVYSGTSVDIRIGNRSLTIVRPGGGELYADSDGGTEDRE